jgi:hypothetical protein
MGRKKTPRKRMGKKERGQFGALLKHVKAFKIFPQQKKLGETKLNTFLINHLLQRNLGVENKNITPAKFVGESFRPECLLRGSGKYRLCAIECKNSTTNSPRPGGKRASVRRCCMRKSTKP